MQWIRYGRDKSVGNKLDTVEIKVLAINYHGRDKSVMQKLEAIVI